jgi:hypothetical protein
VKTAIKTAIGTVVVSAGSKSATAERLEEKMTAEMIAERIVMTVETADVRAPEERMVAMIGRPAGHQAEVEIEEEEAAAAEEEVLQESHVEVASIRKRCCQRILQ